MNGKLHIQGIECYAYHGCLEEEVEIGQRYTVDIFLELDIAKAMAEDDLKNTVDYVAVSNIVKKEMSVRSDLIEHVAGRILNSLKMAFPGLQSLSVTVHKYNPPVNALIERASITISERTGQ